MACILVSKRDIITAISDKPFSGSNEDRMMEVKGPIEARKLLGRRVGKSRAVKKLAVVCNWGQECGISTYTKYLVDALREYIPEIRIFSEEGTFDTPDIKVCWKRGETMYRAMQEVTRWQPDFTMIQHEFGLFPKAPYLLQMLQALDFMPYAVTLHSTYEHLDKTICTAAMKQIIVHTEAAKGVLRSLGNNNRIDVVPHGCVEFEDRKELWNIFQTPHAIVQFGFGFFYKGVDRAVDAIHLLKTRNPQKYDDIFYCYLCSENPHTKNVHQEYSEFITKKINDLGLQDNVAIVRKFHSDAEINNYMRTAKLAIFPYLINPGNTVYGASGAIRISMANGIPVLASESHLFDELPVPRPDSAERLAEEIDKVFGNWRHRDALITTQDQYIKDNAWPKVALKYKLVMEDIRNNTYVFFE